MVKLLLFLISLTATHSGLGWIERDTGETEAGRRVHLNR